MDSNFQVKITVDLSQLQGRLKEVDSALKSLGFTADESNAKLTKSFERTAEAAQRVGADMSRVRLATFAFGQVIRDAGFFSQNFGLGMLAISNNIPILIDQLVLLSGVSAGFGAALSLLGSALAAGLTVFAYWAQGVERDGGSVSGAINQMVNDSESALGRLVDYFSKPPASEILGKVIEGTEEAIGIIKNIIDIGVDIVIAIWDRFGDEIEQVFNTVYQVAYGVMNNVLNIFKFALSVIKGDWEGAFNAILNIGKNVINTLISLFQLLVTGASQAAGFIVGLVDPLKGETIKNAGKEFNLLTDQLKFAKDASDSAGFSLRDYLTNLFKVEKQAGKTGKEIEKLNKGQREPALPKGLYGKDTLNEFQRLLFQPIKGKEVKKFELFPSNLGMHEKEQLKNFVLAIEETEREINDIFVNGIVATIGNSMMAIGQAFATGGNVAAAFGTAILGSLSSVLSQLADKLIAAGIAGLTFSNAMKNLFDPKNWALALAAGVALKVAAGAAGGFARKLSGGGASGMTSGSGASPTPSFGRINTFSVNTGMTASSSIASTINAQPVLETRVSGNDLVILMNRASTNRNNYF